MSLPEEEKWLDVLETDGDRMARAAWHSGANDQFWLFAGSSVRQRDVTTLRRWVRVLERRPDWLFAAGAGAIARAALITAIDPAAADAAQRLHDALAGLPLAEPQPDAGADRGGWWCRVEHQLRRHEWPRPLNAAWVFACVRHWLSSERASAFEVRVPVAGERVRNGVRQGFLATLVLTRVPHACPSGASGVVFHDPVDLFHTTIGPEFHESMTDAWLAAGGDLSADGCYRILDGWSPGASPPPLPSASDRSASGAAYSGWSALAAAARAGRQPATDARVIVIGQVEQDLDAWRLAPVDPEGLASKIDAIVHQSRIDTIVLAAGNGDHVSVRPPLRRQSRRAGRIVLRVDRGLVQPPPSR